MSDTDTFVDYQFEFAHGEPIFVSNVLEGRDEVAASESHITFTLRHGATPEVVTVYLRGLNACRVTQRIEPKQVIGEYLREAEQIRHDGK